jgi:hypothetical protein
MALPSAPSDVAVASDGSVWATLPDSLARIDPSTGVVTTEYSNLFSAKRGDLTGMAIQQLGEWQIAWISDSGGYVWPAAIVVPLDLAAPVLPPRPIEVGGPALGVAFGDGSVWVTVAHDGPGELVRIDPKTNQITGRFMTGDGPGSVAVGDGGVWVQVTSGDARLQRFDPTTGELVGEQGGGWLVAANADEVWASGSDTVQRLTPTTKVNIGASPAPNGGFPSPSPDPSARVPGTGALTIAGDQVWAVALPNPDNNGLLYEIDRRSGDIIGSPTPLGLTPTALAVGNGSVWVANYNDPSLTRVELRCGSVACGGPSPAPTTGPNPTITGGTTRTPGIRLPTPPVPYLFGTHLVGGGFDATIAALPEGREVGTLSPVASFLPDGRMLYLAWDSASQSTEVHVFDPGSGDDRVGIGGVSSVAVRNDGAIAYSIGHTGIYTQPLLPSPTTSLGVMSGIDVTPDARFDSSVSWVFGPGPYVTVGWAGDTLLAYHQTDGETWDVLAIDGPNRVRTLAQNARIVAISPDGTDVMLDVSSGPADTLQTWTLMRVTDGSVVTSREFTAKFDHEMGVDLGSLGSGDWIGDLVLADTGAETVILRVGSTISVDQTVGTDLVEPQFVSGDPARVIGWRKEFTPGGLMNGPYRCNEVSGNWRCFNRFATGNPVRPARSLTRPAAVDSGPP